MNGKQIESLLNEVKNGTLNISDAVEQLRALPFENVEGFARLDHHRSIRCGFPEVVFGEGKSPEHLVKITRQLIQKSEKVLITRLAPEIFAQIQDQMPENGNYDPNARIYSIDRSNEERVPGVLVLSAGTSDIPVAEEAAQTAELAGNIVERIYDVGVAGLHRLLAHTENLQAATVIIVVAGMDGALPSVVAGLVNVPVIAVPTSIGYGASLGGIAALLTMLNSCASGISVVNIDNGFGAGYLASIINHQSCH
ncbi:MAG: nickel pincer cofactor biosynthesis protein LarB [Anaerolineae bacterium]|jgi:NCAIR mutase (PurE)-related protein|nr:nickel pincer cofactor biosynthesis protein LarB [Anaerolineae bacterium]